jgi:GGDEF domain-containing protein
VTLDVQVTTKRTLVAVSHAIERFALAGGADRPTAVIALFQRMSYFEREVEVYRRIAAEAAVTLVGVVEDLPPALPPGIGHALLRRDEPLAHEWSVTVLSPRSGATLVARDRETVGADAPTLEAGREFEAGWSFRREDAYREVVRLRGALRERVAGSAVAALDDVLRQVVAAPGQPGEERADAALRHLAGVLDEANAGAGALVRERDQVPVPAHPEWDQVTGLRNERYLRRWLAGAADGVLPLGLLLLQVRDLPEIRAQHGTAAAIAAMQLVAGVVRRHLGAADRAVGLGNDSVLLVLPSARAPELERLHEGIAADVEQEGKSQYPFVPLRTSAVATVTRERPLPTESLVEAAWRVEPRQVALLAG